MQDCTLAFGKVASHSNGARHHCGSQHRSSFVSYKDHCRPFLPLRTPRNSQRTRRESSVLSASLPPRAPRLSSVAAWPRCEGPHHERHNHKTRSHDGGLADLPQPRSDRFRQRLGGDGADLSEREVGAASGRRCPPSRAARTRTFEDDYMLKTQKKVAKKIKKRYEAQREEGQPHCMFARVELDDDLDQWKVRRQNLRFHWADEELEPFEVRLLARPGDVRVQHQAGAAGLVLRRAVRDVPGRVPVEDAAQARAVVRHRARRGTVFALGQDVPARAACWPTTSPTKLNHPELAHVDHGLAQPRRPRVPRHPATAGGVSAGLEAVLGRRLPSPRHRRPDGRERLSRPRLRTGAVARPRD